MRRFIPLVLLVTAGCGTSTAPVNRQAAIDAFAKEVEPEVGRLLSGTMFDPPVQPSYASPAHFGNQSTDSPLNGERVLRDGTLPGGATFWVEAFFSYSEARIQSVSIVVDFPAPEGHKPGRNVDITPTLLGKLKIHPALIDALMQGIGKGAMSGSGPRGFQASAEVAGKRFEASTAIVRDKPLLLELSCSYFR